MRYTVFYGHQVYMESDTWTPIWKALNSMPDGVYILDSGAPYLGSLSNDGWALKDLTPVLIEDVPAELRMLQLLLNL